MAPKPLYILVRQLRCHQWVKNMFVFAAPVFGKQIFIPEQFLKTVEAFFAFSLAASAVYVLNDIIDLEEDRLHPQKKDRPLAAGLISMAQARILILLLVIASMGISFGLVSPLTGIVTIIYLLSNIGYSLYLKHVVILDIMFIAVAFILRIMAGAFATAVMPSTWLILCTFNISFFLGFSKRRAEITVLGNHAAEHRSVLQHYSLTFLDQMIAIVTGATLVCYILYTVDQRNIDVFGSPYLILTIPFVMYGMFRYLYLVYHLDLGGSPASAMLRDFPFLLNMLLWGVIALGVINYGARLQAWIPL